MTHWNSVPKAFHSVSDRRGETVGKRTPETSPKGGIFLAEKKKKGIYSRFLSILITGGSIHPSRKELASRTEPCPDPQTSPFHHCVPYPPGSKGNVSNTELPPEIRSICKVCACSHGVEIHLAVSGRKEQCLRRCKTRRLASQIQFIRAPGPTLRMP